MNSIDDSNKTAKNLAETTEAEHTSTPQNPDSFAEILLLLRGIGLRLDHLEQRFEFLDRDVLKAIDAESIAVTDAEPEPRRVPSLAFTANGRVILSVAYLGDIDLGERETWTGIMLSEAEACDALDALADGCDDAAAHVGGRIIAKARKKSEPQGSGGHGHE